jgi:hypothetical protein
MSSGIEVGTFWLVAQSLNQLRYRVLLNKTIFGMETAIDGPRPQILTNVILLSW